MRTLKEPHSKLQPHSSPGNFPGREVPVARPKIVATDDDWAEAPGKPLLENKAVRRFTASEGGGNYCICRILILFTDWRINSLRGESLGYNEYTTAGGHSEPP